MWLKHLPIFSALRLRGSTQRLYTVGLIICCVLGLSNCIAAFCGSNRPGTPSGKRVEVAQLLWKKVIGRAEIYMPAISKLNIIYASCDHRGFYAFSTKGKYLWKYDCCAVDSPPAVGPNGYVYFWSDDGTAHCFSPRGKPVWTFHSGQASWSCAPQFTSPGNVLFGTSKGAVYCLNNYGRKVWKLVVNSNQNDFDAVSVICDQKHIYLASRTKLSAFSENGQVQWVRTIKSQIKSGPVLRAKSMICIATSSHVVQCYDSNGSLLWSKSFSGACAIAARPQDRELYIMVENEGLYSVSNTFHIQWCVHVPLTRSSQPNGQSNTIIPPYAAPNDDIYCLLKPKLLGKVSFSGKLLWIYKLPAPGDTTPVTGVGDRVFEATFGSNHDVSCLLAIGTRN